MAVAGPGVVAGFDGSASSVRALEWAADEAALRKARLTLCHVWEHPPPARPGDPAPAGRSAARAVWLAAERTLERGVTLATQRHPGLVIVPRLLAGQAAPALVRASEGAELLVAGTRGTGNWQWPGLGSVSTQLASTARCPLLVVPDDGIWRQRPVIVGVDGSASSQHAAGFAVEEASLRGVPVIAVCCWAGQYPPGGTDPAGLPGCAEARRRAEARAELATRPWHRKYPEVTVTTSLRAGHPARVLRDAADQASLLVLGAWGSGGIPGRLLGSVTHEILENVAHPVAVVR